MALAVQLLLVAGAAQAAAPALDVLLKRIAVSDAKEVPFEERRFVSSVTEPLVTRGYLRFDPPDMLIKKIEEPYRETAIVDSDSVRLLNAEGEETASIDLWMSEDLRLVFDSLRAVLSANVSILRSLFEISISGDENAWTLVLSPKIDRDATRIDRILVSGDLDRMRRFDILESNGDRSIIRLYGTSSLP